MGWEEYWRGGLQVLPPFHSLVLPSLSPPNPRSFIAGSNFSSFSSPDLPLVVLVMEAKALSMPANTLPLSYAPSSEFHLRTASCLPWQAGQLWVLADSLLLVRLSPLA